MVTDRDKLPCDVTIDVGTASPELRELARRAVEAREANVARDFDPRYLRQLAEFIVDGFEDGDR